MTLATSPRRSATNSAAQPEPQAAGLEPREREQVGDEAPEAVGLDLHRADEVVADLGDVLRPVVEQLEHALERGDRRAHLVARVGDEAALRVLDAVLLGHVGEQQHRAGDRVGVEQRRAVQQHDELAERDGLGGALACEPLAHDLEHRGLGR